MKRRGLESRSLSSCVALALALFVGGCAWGTWIPGEKNWNPPVVADPTTFAEFLPLGSVRVDELNCYSQRCKKRFRVIVGESGVLTVRVIPELVGPDAQARIVLEAIRGVLAQASTGRGPRTDVTVLALRESVNAGTYFVLIESVGGPMKYEIGAYLEPGPGPAPGTTAAAPPPEKVARPKKDWPSAPATRLVDVKLPGRAGARYDPKVSFANLRTFAFARTAQAGDDLPAGTVIDGPGDRQIRRFLAEDLRLKGFRPAAGRDPADLHVEFSTSDATQLYYRAPFIWYDQFSLDAYRPGLPYKAQANVASRLTVVIVEAQSGRVAWFGASAKSLGPGIDFGAETTALAREAVSDILAKFPPN
ncbi:MAG: DUF4136 domain-containing protein [Deltaproteobacteria bacterium]|nr:DUF4136 domain-containing protein [Deltaproteobacteria bacterium]MBW2396331.1 DUF4136 domain-containing protein [Deltaproteobacteria bacterium]